MTANDETRFSRAFGPVRRAPAGPTSKRDDSVDLTDSTPMREHEKVGELKSESSSLLHLLTFIAGIALQNYKYM